MNIIKLTDRARPGSVGDIRIADLGRRVSLTLGNDIGQTLCISLTHGELAGFIEALIDLAVDAAKARTGNRRAPLTVAPPARFARSEVTDIGVAASAGIASHAHLVLRLHDIDLSFRLDRDRLEDLADTLGHAAHALQADERVRH
ncbi:MAG: hypothetical protein U9P00_11930 [Pseudomonadota bacterium]|nr:hypothetical protein [Pseudomonadota bacterium]